MTTHRIFSSDPEFCPDCGTILPVPGIEDFVNCKRCDFSAPVEAFFGIERISSVVFNKPKTKRERKIAKDTNASVPTASTGPKVDRKCGKCGHDEMTYRTQQLRSADEGQTVFYTCTNCLHQEVEQS